MTTTNPEIHLESIQEMFRELSNGPEQVLPSLYWVELNERHMHQLHEDGIANFKRTLAKNYFTFLVKPDNPQFQYLLRNLPPLLVLRSLFGALTAGTHRPFRFKGSLMYNFFTYLIWNFMEWKDSKKISQGIAEPLDGDPPRITQRGKLISQDLANSLLEYMSVLEGVDNPNELRSIMEIGAGYGRTAFVFLTRMPWLKYIVVDIPPALYISQHYLTHQFPDRSVFKFRPFSHFSQIQEEFEKAQLAFLLPSQLELIPHKAVDLLINISSFHEMRKDQIEYYFLLIPRLVKHWLYLKQAKISSIPFENIVIREEDYPIRTDWEKIYWRECQVQTNFFETLLKLS